MRSEKEQERRKGSLLAVGVGEAFDSGLGNTSWLLSGGTLPTVLFDCGYQIPERLWRLPEATSLDAVVFTHLHADHSFGVVPLLTRLWEEKRRDPMTIFGPPGTEVFVRKLFDLGYPGLRPKLGFELRFVPLRTGGSLRWKQLRFRVARTTHSILNHTVRVDLPGGASLAVSGDGAPTPESLELVRGVGFLAQECFWRKPRGAGHASLEELLKRIPPETQQIGLVHRSRAEKVAILRAVGAIRKRDPRWQVIQPGDRILLG